MPLPSILPSIQVAASKRPRCAEQALSIDPLPCLTPPAPYSSSLPCTLDASAHALLSLPGAASLAASSTSAKQLIKQLPSTSSTRALGLHTPSPFIQRPLSCTCDIDTHVPCSMPCSASSASAKRPVKQLAGGSGSEQALNLNMPSPFIQRPPTPEELKAWGACISNKQEWSEAAAVLRQYYHLHGFGITSRNAALRCGATQCEASCRLCRSHSLASPLLP